MSVSAPVKAAPVKVAAPAVKPALTAVRGPLLQRACSCGGAPGMSGECEECRKKKQVVQRSAAGAATPVTAPASVQQTLSSPGRPLDSAAQSTLGSRFGHDFSRVRIHDDLQAAESARAVDAHAYTVGEHIAFGSGKYQPQTPAGERLLAHELAHTIQQRGLQRAGTNLSLDRGAEYQRLEREADTAASAVMQGEPAAVTRSASQPTLSRAGKAATSNEGVITPAKTKKAKKKSSSLGSHSVTPTEVFSQDGKALEEFQVDQFYLPAAKGPNAFAIYDGMAGKSLESTLAIQGTGKTKTALWQERPSTDDLRDLWLNKVGWTATSADDLWQRSGGDKTFPQVGGKTCQMDHIVELQIGGDNTPENIQPLDAGPNQSSGGAIKGELQTLAVAIAEDQDLSGGDPDEVKLRFAAVKQQGAAAKLPSACPVKGAARSCLAVEDCAKKLKVEKTASGAVQIARVDYPITAGGRPTTNLKVPVTFATRADEKVPIEGDALNEGAATLIPGLLLTTLTHGAGKGKGAKQDIVHARIDDRDKTRLPLSVDPKTKPLRLRVGTDGDLKLDPADKKGGIGFTYKYLSPGKITEIGVDETGETSWKGTITPGVPLLGKLGVEYSKGTLLVTKGLDEATLKKLKVLGMRVTKAQIELQLAPEFKPRGVIELQMGSDKRPLALVTLSLEADDVGLVAKGKLKVNIPKLETAESDVTYRGGGGRNEWSASIHIKSENVKLGAGISVTGELLGQIEKDQVRFDGKLDLGLPGDNSATLGLRRGGKGDWILYGHGFFKVPRVDRVRAEVVYELERDVLTATVATATGFKIPKIGLTGNLEKLTVTLTKGKNLTATGTGRLDFKKGKVAGYVKVNLLPSGKFSGEGGISYEIKPGLIAAAGVSLDENEKIKITGTLTFPPYVLFDKFPKPPKDRIDIFRFGPKKFGVPYLSFGPVGLQARIKAGIFANYSIGPATIVGGFIKTVIDNPLDEKPDVDLELGGKLTLPVSFSITGYVSGGLVLDIGIAEAGGEITVSASAILSGEAGSNFWAHYGQGKFEASADLSVLLKLIFTLCFDAYAWAEAGVWRFKVSTSKSWHLGHFTYDPGLKLGMKMNKPLRYSSETGFDTDGILNNIEWIKPSFDTGNALESSFGKVGGDESEGKPKPNPCPKVYDDE